MEASIRNVLGDIGNRIGLGNVQLGGAKNESTLNAKPIDVLKHQQQQQHQQQQLRITKTCTTTTTTTTKMGQTLVVQQQQHQQRQESTVTVKQQQHQQHELMSVQQEESSGVGCMDTNNSCIMLDESEQNDDDIEIDETTETEGEEEEEEEEAVDEEDEDDDEEIMYSDEEEEEEDVETAAAAAENEIVDIDALDADDPQLCTTYVREIYSYLTHLERKYRVSPSFLDKKSVTSRMRSVLIDWLIQVHNKFQLLQETMYLTVHLIDAYLERCDVSKMQLQLVGVTAMFLASKYEEMYVPAIDDFVYMTDNTYTKSEIRKMEVNMCKTLDFGFGKPFPLHFLRRFSKASQADPKQHTLAKYFMELSLHDADFATMDPSLLAACSLNLAFQLLNGPQWNKNLEHYSGYKASDLEEGMAKLANLALKAMDLNYKYRAATNKYAASKCLRISLIPELSSKYMRELAAKAPVSQP